MHGEKLKHSYMKGTSIMARTITVKGVGKATVKPDQVVIRMSFEAKDKSYDQAMALAAQQAADLKQAFEG